MASVVYVSLINYKEFIMSVDAEMWKEDEKAADAFQAKYPELFIKRGKPMNSMNGGLGIGKGWYSLLDEACQMLESYRNQCPEIHILQIKEKFARLTIYIGFNHASQELCKEIYDKLQEICNRSSFICEDCGTKESVTTSASGGYWLRTLCESCHFSRGAKGGKLSDFDAARKVLDQIKEELNQ